MSKQASELQKLLKAVKRSQAWRMEQKLPAWSMLSELESLLRDAINPPPPEPELPPLRPEDDVRGETHEYFGPPVGVFRHGPLGPGHPGQFEYANSKEELQSFLAKGWKVFGE